MKDSLQKNYDCDNPMRSKIVKEKHKKTCLKNYGVEYPSQSNVVKEKIKNTCRKKYGVEHPMNLHEVKEKQKTTSLRNYGVEFPMQNSEVFEKTIAALFRKKEYIWKTGEISIVQGNEPIVLKELEDKGYFFCDVKTSQIDMPQFWYDFEGKRRRYFPDIYIPKENLIIEVKSEYTLKLNSEKNKLKFESVKLAGYNFRLEVR